MTPRERKKLRRTRRKSSKVLLGVGVVFAVVAISALSFGIWVLNVAASAPSIDELRPIDKGANTVVFAADGTRLGYIQNDELRTPIPLKAIPKEFQQASIAIEDERFYEHDGVDLEAVARAAVENVEAGETLQGGSTITQQLVRNLYISDPEDTLERKIREAALAEDLEQERTKKWILEQYLNTASYGTVNGRTAIGVEAASQTFFNKPATEMKLTESALLAGLPQAPSQYNPFTDPESAIRRRNNVLDNMAKQGDITPKKAQAAKGAGLGLESGSKYSEILEPFFFDYVEQQLISRYGVNTVRQGGLQVRTTIDPELQNAAEEAIVANPVSGAANSLVSTEVDTGEIIAMASSSAYDSSQFNLAAQGSRQPGSAFKPFVLTTAVSQGIDPDTTYYSAPSTITLDTGGTPWTVSGGGGGSMSLRDATAQSVNTVYAQVGLDVGADNFTEMAKEMGITSPLEPFPAYALGGTAECCTVLEMSNAYGTIASGGVHHDPTGIREVEFPDGEVDRFEDPEGKRVISEGVAYEVADVMKGTLISGTAAGYGINCPASGKTGTTEEQSDAWFVGYTPHVSTAVWTGNPDARVPLPGYGADLSAPIWQDYMSTAAAQPCDDFPEPDTPASLSPYYSDNATTGEGPENSSYDDGTGVAPAPVTPAPDTGTGGTYDPDLYAPGVGQDPVAPPPADTGGDDDG
ncbi:MAG: transglycosylase domain-containing protein [Solirubrobacterales bacterium]